MAQVPQADHETGASRSRRRIVAEATAADVLEREHDPVLRHTARLEIERDAPLGPVVLDPELAVDDVETWMRGAWTRSFPFHRVQGVTPLRRIRS